MNARGTAAFLNASGISAVADDSIQRFEMQKQQSSLTITLWVASMSPLMNILMRNSVPYVDGCICLYHDHDALSCMRVESAMEMLKPLHDWIALMPTTIPRVNRHHESRIHTYYNKDGFERPQLTGNLIENIQKMALNTKVLKYI